MFFGSYETNEITNMVVSATGHKAQQNNETGSKDKQAHPPIRSISTSFALTLTVSGLQ